MAVCVPDEIIKYGRVDDVQQPRPSIVWRHLLHRLAVTLIILPPAGLTTQTQHAAVTLIQVVAEQKNNTPHCVLDSAETPGTNMFFLS